jgi:hypothetical protein
MSMMGRPPKFQTNEEFEAVAEAYFLACEDPDKPEVPTVNGLCMALDICRDTLWEYAKKPDFSDAVKRARTRLEAAWEKRLAGNACTGAIFWLKNQGWSDRAELTLGGDVKTSLDIRFVD